MSNHPFNFSLFEGRMDPDDARDIEVADALIERAEQNEKAKAQAQAAAKAAAETEAGREAQGGSAS
jgi:hypothetical protein